MLRFWRRCVKGDDIEGAVNVQFARLAVGAGAVVVVDAKGEVAGLLYFVDHDVLAQGVYCAGGYEDHIAFLYIEELHGVLYAVFADG